MFVSNINWTVVFLFHDAGEKNLLLYTYRIYMGIAMFNFYAKGEQIYQVVLLFFRRKIYLRVKLLKIKITLILEKDKKC